MKNIIISAFVIVSAIVQSSILPYFKIFNAKPDILIIIAVFFSLYFPFRKALIIVLACGLLKDVLSAGAFGLNFSSFAICFFIIRGLKQFFYQDDFFKHLAMVYIISLSNGIIYFLLRVIFVDDFTNFLFLLIICLESIYTTAISPIIFILFRKCVLRPSI